MTREETQITWAAAASKSVAFGASEASDAFSFNVGGWGAVIQLSADNEGTPADGDAVDFYALYTAGDILGDGGDDFDTAKHGQFLCRLDTYATNTPGEDPARKTVSLDVAAKGLKVLARNNSSGRAITVRARVVELVGAVA